MKKVLLVIVALAILLVAAIATYSAKKESIPQLKAPIMPKIKIKPVAYASDKLKIGEITTSYENVHKKKKHKKYIDANFTFFTNKPAIVSLKYGKGLRFESPTTVSNSSKDYKTKHKITIHEIEPATNFLYQVTAVTKTSEKTESEKKGFLTPQLEEEGPEAGSFFMRPINAARNLIKNFLDTEE